ncbi:hypothetical protein KSS87_015040, partial [Heliosperma pusillum]
MLLLCYSIIIFVLLHCYFGVCYSIIILVLLHCYFCVIPFVSLNCSLLLLCYSIVILVHCYFGITPLLFLF